VISIDEAMERPSSGPPSHAASRASLPIDPLLPRVADALARGRRLLLRAAPGAGKTTRVPAALLDAGLAGRGSVLVLEPRRIAARAAAEYVAAARGGVVGDEVGYRVRFEHRGGATTRLWFVTEGVFGRRLADDPFLEDIGVVVLDEFHERHLQGDLALAVVRELQDSVRPDLKLAVMSATLATDALARHLPDAVVLASEGRAHPVAIAWAPLPPRRRLAEHVAGLVRDALREPGDVLVFLPGAAEIRRTAEALGTLRDVDVVPLHGDQPLGEQQRALRAGPRRRVVLATNVAETALTVDGVTTVVDSGLARVARFDPRHGLDRLVVAPISRSSAEQRAGRAGRLGPGRCIRAWSREEHAGRRDHETPEIVRLDLTRTVLELRAWGLRHADALPWLDPPPPTALTHAEQLLVRLGAVDPGDGALTDVGRRVLALPASPRLARMQIEAADAGAGGAGALLAALAGERDILLGGRAFGGSAIDRPPGPSDLLVRADLFVEAERRGFSAGACHALGLDPRAVRAVERARRQLSRAARGGVVDPDRDRLLRCVLAGFPDRVCRRRAPGSDRAVMVGGTGVVLAPESVVREDELFVALDLEGGGRRPDAVVRIASAVRREWLAALFPGAVGTEAALVFDDARAAVVERRRECYADLVLAETVRSDVDRARAGALLADAVIADPGLVGRVVADQAPVLARLRFLAHFMPDCGVPVDPLPLLADAIRACAAGLRSVAELLEADLGGALRVLLTHAQRAALERDAPSRFRLPTGREVPIAYEPDRPPWVSARIQELFGLRATPRLAGGRVALVVHVLAPNRRPVQVTDDLASFWRTTYSEVRKQLRGRYPKHAWPEDPLVATPTGRAGRHG
jgi:ATP-dependent helicase HrpB